MWVRDATAADAGALAEVFFVAIRHGSSAYSETQRAAWAARQPSAEDWMRRLDGLQTVVADDGGAPLGFAAMRPDDGYLDLAFVRPDAQGQGVFARIYAVIENRARAAGLAQMHTQASHMLKPALLSLDWSCLRANRVMRGDVVIDNWIMSKPLAD